MNWIFPEKKKVNPLVEMGTVSQEDFEKYKNKYLLLNHQVVASDLLIFFLDDLGLESTENIHVVKFDVINKIWEIIPKKSAKPSEYSHKELAEAALVLQLEVFPDTMKNFVSFASAAFHLKDLENL